MKKEKSKRKERDINEIKDIEERVKGGEGEENPVGEIKRRRMILESESAEVREQINEINLIESLKKPKKKKTKMKPKKNDQNRNNTTVPSINVREAQHQQSGKMNKWNFVVEYNDHFETPQQAYVDLLQVLKQSARDIGKRFEDLIVYDPYYCDGRVVTLLNNLGITNVINQNRDFYHDLESNLIPEYDILVTNPPYSGEHKQRLLQYLRTISKPYALLLPAYTATKSYWREFVEFENQRWKSNKGVGDSILYLLPPSSYEYCHPEGTGKELPPFYSAWFIGGTFSSLTSLRHACSSPLSPAGNPSLPPGCSYRCLTVLTSVESLISRGYVTDSTKRPNPKQRKKMKQKGASS